ncbi:MAG TPA: hypothetical protein VD862_04500 [Candidatus Paceibacterota bacterium]|nr:hypothetical protein [Candidatus Paceibacterota bacterium]
MSMTGYRNKGQIAVQVLIFSAVSIIILTGFVLWADTNVRLVWRDSDAEQAFLIAEAGIEYYRWHLAHAPKDYQDGTGAPGPYVHDYRDKDGNLIGTFTLDISPPATGSTLLTIRSTGTLTVNPDAEKIIEAQMDIPSFAKYSAIIGSYVFFGPGSEIFGPVHSNSGVRIDGIAHNLVTSAVAEFNDPDHSGQDEFGVHTHVAPQDPLPPAAVPNRPDVFKAGRQFPVPPIDFAGLSQDLANLKASAQADGFYRNTVGNKGYHIILKTNDTFDLYDVTDTIKAPNGCVSVLGEQDWDTWSIEDETFLGNYPFPDNGIIFIEDHVWIDGQINTARITIATGRFPENPAHRMHITVNRDLLYTNYDGQDIISLVAQGNVNAGWDSEDDLRIDGALLAQSNRVGRYYYRPPSGNQPRCSPNHVRQKITLYGMIGSEERYGFAWSDGTGYQQRIIIYDPNLLFYPPPSFPKTSSYYTPINWNEIK